MSGPGQKIDEQAVLQRFQMMVQELRMIAGKIQELDGEKMEHNTVIRQLEKLNGDRKCYRLVGGVLVERTVKDVLPQLVSNRDGIQQMMEALQGKLTQQEEQLAEFQKRFNIRIKGQPEEDSEEQRGKSTGVLV